jgi:hypothetical protein
MKYSFEAKIEKTDQGCKVEIPFNIWEVSKHRDEVEAELHRDGKVIPCKLLPLEKGKYELLIQGECAQNADLSKEQHILLRIPATLIKVDKESPYSPENPIRKIDSINILIQPEDGLC